MMTGKGDSDTVLQLPQSYSSVFNASDLEINLKLGWAYTVEEFGRRDIHDITLNMVCRMFLSSIILV